MPTTATKGLGWEKTARSTYNAYCLSLSHLSHATGNPLPVFEDLPEANRAAWEAAARQARRCLEDVQSPDDPVPDEDVWRTWLPAWQGKRRAGESGTFATPRPAVVGVALLHALAASVLLCLALGVSSHCSAGRSAAVSTTEVPAVCPIYELEQRAERLFEAGLDAEATSACLDLIRKDGRNARAHYVIGWTYLRAGNRTMARHYLSLAAGYGDEILAPRLLRRMSDGRV